MNRWTELSIKYANQRSYLDDLFQVYPTIPEGIRDINQDIWSNVEKFFNHKNNDVFIRMYKSITKTYKDYNIMSALVLGYGNIKDLILFYTKSSKPIWNEPREKYTEKTLKNYFLK